MGASDFSNLPHIGEAVKRKEDYRFLTGNGQYTDDITLANQSYAVFVRSPHAHAAIKSVDIGEAREDARRDRHLQRQGHRRQDGRAALRLAHQQPRRHADEGAAASDPGHRQGALRGRPCRHGGGRKRGAGQERGRSGGGRLRRAAAGGRPARCRQEGRPGDPRRRARQPVLQVDAGRQGQGRRRLCPGGPCHQARPGQQPADPQRHRAARGHRQLQPRAPRSTRSTSPTRTRTSSAC